VVALDERLLDILVCPACRSSVEYKERRHVVVCTECARRYPVQDGIPIMLLDAPPSGAAPAPAASGD
jgi:uncharacterized protein